MIRLKARLLIVSIYQLLPQAYILLLILSSEVLGKYNFILKVLFSKSWLQTASENQKTLENEDGF